ncbi:hypothetical protein KCU61_g3456, partial [Aureobasidium melanogenum]
MISVYNGIVWTTLFTVLNAQSVFNIYPDVNPTLLSTSLGFSETCLDALNVTVTCDPDLFRMVGQIDQYLWSEDNITALCTSDCIGSSSDWIVTVQTACEGEQMAVASKLVPVEDIAGRYVDGIGLACMDSGTLAIEFLPLFDAEIRNESTNDTMDMNGNNPDADDYGDLGSNSTNTTAPTLLGNTTIEENYVNYTSCFLESQNWVGSDDIQVDCDEDPTNALCSDPDAGTRIANLYNDTLLCSQCFISVMWWRINSMYLPDTDYSDYLIDQYQDILDVCNVTTVPDTIIRPLPNYPQAPNVTYLPPGTDPGDNSTTNVNATCNGQTITPGTSGCDALSTQYGVTTGDLQAVTDTDDCSSSNKVCVPLSCSLSQVTSNASCDTLAASFSTSTLNVTTSLFLFWNPNVMGLCDSVTEGQYVCSGAPGGSYDLPPPINGTNTDASQQNRGGSGSDSSNPNGPLGPQGPTPNSTQTAPTQPGIVSYCNAFTTAPANGTCYDFTLEYHITLEQFTTWNPVLGYPDGHNCSTQFWTGYDYCVGIVNGTSATTTSSTASISTTSQSTTSLPYPTQSGIVSNCNKFVEAVSGDYCSKFASDNGITTAQLYAWNPVLGSTGQNCDTAFFAGYDYCVGISGPTTTTTSQIPTQTGISAQCTKVVEAVSGDYCSKFATENGITTTELYTWNPVLGSSGQNCNTAFFAGYGYCVGVSA